MPTDLKIKLPPRPVSPLSTGTSSAVEKYLGAVYHGTEVGGLVAQIGNKVLREDYPIQVLNDQETVAGMVLVLHAV